MKEEKTWRRNFITQVAKEGDRLTITITLPKSRFKWGELVKVESKVKKLRKKVV
jgi:hypothetical protein